MSDNEFGTRAHDLLAELGQAIGISGLGFDEQGYCCLAFDDAILNLELDRVRREVLVYAEIAPLASNIASAELLDILQANHYATLTGSGSIGIDRGAERIYLSDRMLYDALDAKAFQARITEFIDRVEGWQRYLTRPGDRTETQDEWLTNGGIRI